MTKPGVVGYLDALYASPGDEVVLRVSVLDGGGRYRASLARLICGETGSGGPGLKEEAIPCAIDGEHDGAGAQPIQDRGKVGLIDRPALEHSRSAHARAPWTDGRL